MSTQSPASNASNQARPLLISQGDPRGVGPELILMAAKEGLIAAEDQIVAGQSAFEALFKSDAMPWAKDAYAKIEHQLVGPGGKGSRVVSMNQVEVLELAVELLATSAESDRLALVTAPIHKADAVKEGLSFHGHTEFLAARAKVQDFAMLMAGPVLRVVLATTHLALKDVPAKLSIDSIVASGRLLAESLRRDYACETPRIGVFGLNPHAGEEGLLGREELELYPEVLEKLRTVCPGAEFEGPVAADSAIGHHAQGRYDGVVAMYHDQGLAPFKLMHFYDGINVTLGLPYLRTSPDHGTARAIVGQGIVDPRSFFASIRFARNGAKGAFDR